MRPNFWKQAKRELTANDPLMAAFFKAFPRIYMESRGDPFLTLVRSIVGQQISVKAAQSIWNRLLLVAPEMRPEKILAIGASDLRLCGLSGRKIEYIIDLAGRFFDGSLRVSEWSRMSDELIIADLIQVRGVGRWTAEMFLMFNLQRPDVLPLDDLGLQKAVGHYYFLGEPVSRDGLRELAEQWRPWRSVATWYLWRSLEPVPVAY